MTFSKTLLISIIAVVLIGGSLGYWYYASQPSDVPQVINGIQTTEQVSTSIEVIVPEKKVLTIASSSIPEGWKDYSDLVLGFSIAYPNDWKLTPYASSSQDPGYYRVSLEKGNAQIIIDPIGISGSSEFNSPVQTKNISINGVDWVHIYSPKDEYHRFIDTKQLRTPRPDLIKYYKDSNGFRLHVSLKKITDEKERNDIVNMATMMLQTITLP